MSNLRSALRLRLDEGNRREKTVLYRADFLISAIRKTFQQTFCGWIDQRVARKGFLFFHAPQLCGIEAPEAQLVKVARVRLGKLRVVDHGLNVDPIGNAAVGFG